MSPLVNSSRVQRPARVITCPLRTAALCLLVGVVFSESVAWAWDDSNGSSESLWPFNRNGVSQRIGNSTYFKSPDLSYNSYRVGKTNYYNGYDNRTRGSFRGSSYQVGNTTYYDVNRYGKGGDFSGDSYKIGNTRYYSGRDRSTGASVSGSSYRIGNTTYYDFYDSDNGQRHSWSSQTIGNSTYYDP